jgi:peptidyl-prolyl cis-trans isomerase C
MPMQEADIMVDGRRITAREVAAELQHHPAATPEAAWQAAGRALVVRRLLLDTAVARGLDADDDAVFDTLLAQEVTVPEPDEAACRRWYAAHPDRFGAPELWEASHILIAANPDHSAEREAAGQRAAALLADVLADPARLPALARLHSDCPSRAEGGHLGQVARGSTVPEFETFLAALAPGQVCPVVVKSRYGMHVVQLHAHVAARAIPFEAARAMVEADLRRAAWHQAVRQYISLLAGRARIEGITMNAAEGPLVQ